MKILAVDTTTSACSVALRTRDLQVSRSAMMERGHAEALLPMVREVLDEASFAFRDIHAIAVTVGPGAFTGLRIGLAAARGMALAAGIPCIGVTSLEAIAEGVEPEQRAGRMLLVALDSKRGDLFAQVFDAGGPAVGVAVAVSIDGLLGILPSGPVIVAGTAASSVVESLARRGVDAVRAEGTGCPHANDVARVAGRRGVAGETSHRPPAPLYLRLPDTGAPTIRPLDRT